MLSLKNLQTVNIHNKDRLSVGLQGGSNDDDEVPIENDDENYEYDDDNGDNFDA